MNWGHGHYATRTAAVRSGPAVVAAAILVLVFQLAGEVFGDTRPVRRLPTVSAKAPTLAEAEALAAKGQWSDAIAACDKLAAGGSAQTRPALLLKAQCLEQVNDPHAALAAYRRVLKEYSRALDAEDVRLRAIRLSALELLQPVGIAELETYLRGNPRGERLRQARWWHAGVAYKQREWDKARDRLTMFLKEFPQAPEAGRARECLLDCEGKLAELAANDLRRAAAITAVRDKAPVAPPRETEARLKAGLAAMGKAKVRDAVAAFEAVRKAGPSPDFDRALYELGRAHEQLGKPDEALAAWDEALKRGTNALWHDDCLLAMGRVLLEEKGRDAAAETAFRTLLADHPTSPLRRAAWVRLGLALLMQERPGEAEAALREARQGRPPGPLDPWDETDRLLLVCAGDTRFWPDRSRLRADSAERREAMRADLFFAAGDYARACRVYERLAAAGKDLETSARSWLQAGRCWNQLRRYDRALACYERFLASPYDRSEFADDALLRAGVIQIGPMNQRRKGKALYERIRERYPGGDHAELAELYLCTLAYWEKDWKGALAGHEAFVKRYPNGPNAEFVRRERLPAIRVALAKP